MMGQGEKIQKERNWQEKWTYNYIENFPIKNNSFKNQCQNKKTSKMFFFSTLTIEYVANFHTLQDSQL